MFVWRFLLKQLKQLKTQTKLPRSEIFRQKRVNSTKIFFLDDELLDEDDEVNAAVVNRRRVAGRNDEDDEFEEDEELTAEREELRKKIGTKKLAKIEEKAARRERNEVI